MGNSQTSSTTVQSPTDPEAARRMAAVAERQQQMAEEQWSLAKEVYLPYEQQMISSNQRLIGSNEAAEKARLDEAARSIALDQPLKDLQREQRMRELGVSDAAVGKFYEAATNGVDPNQRAAQAEADVVGAYADVPESVRRNLSRTGVQLSGGRYNDLMKAIALDRARAIAGAQGTARRAAETESFERLKSAMTARSGIATTDSSAYAQGQEQLGNYTLQNPVNASVGLYNNVVDAYRAGMSPLSNSKSDGRSITF